MFRMRIDAPCSASWDDMAPREGGRFCGTCRAHVHDLTFSTEVQVRAVASLFGATRLCARARFDPAGKGLFLSEPAIVVRAKTRLSLVAAVGLALPMIACGAPRAAVGAAVAAPSACRPEQAGPVMKARPVPVASGAHGSETNDEDHDGIPDATDDCPTVPGPPRSTSSPAGTHGCPSRAVVTSVGAMPVVDYVYFANGQSSLSTESKDLLDAVVRLLAEHPEIVAVAVEGHADQSERNGMALSRARADAVVAWLVSRGATATFVPEGLGDQKPMGTSGTAAARARNRFVGFHIVNP